MSHLLPATVKLQQANILACKLHKSADPSQLLTRRNHHRNRRKKSDTEEDFFFNLEPDWPHTHFRINVLTHILSAHLYKSRDPPSLRKGTEANSAASMLLAVCSYFRGSQLYKITYLE